jgi:15-cis-phytoene synthase
MTPEFRVAVLTDAECKRITRHYARSFFFASHVLPPDKRRAAYAVYAFCRYADEAVDGVETSNADALHARLDIVRRHLDAVYEGTSTYFDAFMHTVRHYNIPRQYFDDLLRGVEMDVTVRRVHDFDELHDYCYCVAGVVGLTMTHIFGATDPDAHPHARALGTAMQLTNILRDVGEDFQRGRIYLPGEELAARGIDLVGGDGMRRTDSFIDYMQFNIDRARDYYAEATEGLRYLADDGSRTCVKLMSATYADILSHIEANDYDVFTRRARVPLLRKLRIGASTILKKL